jgi:hypothetical protein
MTCRLKRPPKEPEGTIPETDIWRAAGPDAQGRLFPLNYRGWGHRNSSVVQLLQVERAGIPPLAADPQRIAAVREADRQK